MKRIFYVLVIVVVAFTFYFYWQTEDTETNLSSNGNKNSNVIPATGLMPITSDRDGNQKIYLMGKGGTFLEKITDTAEKEWGPVIYESGNKLAFFSEKDEYSTISLFLIDRQDRKIIAITHGIPRSMKFSPDGNLIAHLEDASEINQSHDLYLVSVSSGKSERVASGVREYIWNDSSDGIIYTTRESNESIVKTRILTRSIEEDVSLGLENEIAEGGVAPLYLSSTKKILFLDASSEFLKLVSITQRGEKQTELFTIKIRPQEQVDYYMELNLAENSIILNIFSEQVLLDSLLLSLNDEIVRKIELEAESLWWYGSESVIYNKQDQNGKNQIWIKENIDAEEQQITNQGNNWL